MIRTYFTAARCIHVTCSATNTYDWKGALNMNPVTSHMFRTNIDLHSSCPYERKIYSSEGTCTPRTATTFHVKYASLSRQCSRLLYKWCLSVTLTFFETAQSAEQCCSHFLFAIAHHTSFCRLNPCSSLQKFSTTFTASLISNHSYVHVHSKAS